MFSNAQLLQSILVLYNFISIAVAINPMDNYDLEKVNMAAYAILYLNSN